MNKSKKLEECIREYIQEFYAFIHKKASFPLGCAKKLCHFVVKLNHSMNYALRLTPGGKSFFVNNVIVR